MITKRKYIDITPSVCGVTSHQYQLLCGEEGIAEINGQWYAWRGGCSLCVDDKLEELRKEINMSSTNRGGIRNVSDYYVTPVNEIVKFLTELDRINPDVLTEKRTIFDPCAGGDMFHSMSYPTAIEIVKPELKSYILTNDIREDSKAESKRDYLSYDLEIKPHLIITNPPFSHAMPIIKKALGEIDSNGYVVMLLRLNFFGSLKRFPFWQTDMPEYIFVHSKRMSFTEVGGTDSIEYMHAVWHKKQEFCKLKVI